MGDRFARAERPQYETLSFHTVEQPAVREGCGRRAADLLQQISDYSHHVLLHLKCDREPLQDHVESGKAPFIRCMAQGQPEHSAQERIREPLSERPEATKPRTLDAQGGAFLISRKVGALPLGLGPRAPPNRKQKQTVF